MTFFDYYNTEKNMQRLRTGCAVFVLAVFMSWSWAAEPAKKVPANSPGAGNATEEANSPDSDDVLDQAALEQKFAESLSGVVFAGSYSVTTGAKETPAAMEKYTITRVTKIKEKKDAWLFETRIQYGKTDLTVPLVLPVKWAGDTPVITLTNLSIPALGTFTSRVMIYGDRYAGTWQHGKTGGHLWGRIEKIEKPVDAKGSESANGGP
jgi:hypothetical protein